MKNEKLILKGSPEYFDLEAKLNGQAAAGVDDLIYVTVNIPTSCPHCCPICALGSGGGVNLACLGKPVLSSAERNEQIKKAVESGARALVIIGDGEPLWQPADGRPGFNELVRPVLEQAHSLNMTTIMFTTLNFLSSEQAIFLRNHGVTVFISLHSLDPKVYRCSTGNGNLAKVLENLKFLKSVYGKNEVIGGKEVTRLGFNYTVTLLNESGIKEAKDFTHTQGALFVSNTVMAEGRASQEQVWIERVGSEVDFARLAALTKEYSDTGGQSSILNGKCSYGYRGIAFDVDGQMMLCGYKAGPDGLMPNIKNMTARSLRDFHRMVIQSCWNRCETESGSCVHCIPRAETSAQALLERFVAELMKETT